MVWFIDYLKIVGRRDRCGWFRLLASYAEGGNPRPTTLICEETGLDHISDAAWYQELRTKVKADDNCQAFGFTHKKLFTSPWAGHETIHPIDRCFWL